MIRKTKNLLMLLAISVLWATPVFGVDIGESAPYFSITNFDGELVDSAQFKDKNPLLLLFWATWCPKCLKELPELAKTYPGLREQGLKVVAINAAMNDSLRKARSFQQRHALTFPLAFDETFEISRAFEVRGVPTVFLIDIDGKVRYRSPLLPRDLLERVKALK